MPCTKRDDNPFIILLEHLITYWFKYTLNYPLDTNNKWQMSVEYEINGFRNSKRQFVSLFHFWYSKHLSEVDSVMIYKPAERTFIKSKLVLFILIIKKVNPSEKIKTKTKIILHLLLNKSIISELLLICTHRVLINKGCLHVNSNLDAKLLSLWPISISSELSQISGRLSRDFFSFFFWMTSCIDNASIVLGLGL